MCVPLSAAGNKRNRIEFAEEKLHAMEEEEEEVMQKVKKKNKKREHDCRTCNRIWWIWKLNLLRLLVDSPHCSKRIRGGSDYSVWFWLLLRFKRTGRHPSFARTITSADTPQRKAGGPARPHRKADDDDARLDWVWSGDLFAVALKH